MSNAVVHLEVVGNDAPKLIGFYGDLFGWQLDANNPQNYGVGQINDSVFLGVGPTQDGGQGGATFYMAVDSVADSLAKAESLGGQSLMGPMEVPEGPVIGFFADPEGNRIGLFEPRE